MPAVPPVLDRLRRIWAIETGGRYPSSRHWVARVHLADSTPAVLKLGPPADVDREAAALTAYGADGAVRLLAHDSASGALLLECVEPGTPARGLVPGDDEAATAAVIEVVRRLHSAPVPDVGLPELQTARRALVVHLADHPGDDQLPRAFVSAALETFDDLCASSTGRVVVHGDLHHDNVLESDRAGWLAIDPHGWAGDPGFDAGPLLYNPDPTRCDDDLLALVPRRVEQLADGMGLSRDRVARWGFATAMLSEVWSAEDGEAGGRPLAVARLLMAHPAK